MLIPATFKFIWYCCSDLILSGQCSCRSCKKKVQLDSQKKRLDYRKLSSYICLALLGAGWLTSFYLSQEIYKSRQQIQIWNPFTLLEVSSRSSTAYIKRQYKRKSLKYHPDKRGHGLTKEKAEKKFIELTMAYKAYFSSIL
jgi:preprotein translocase subunit Sec63